MKLADFLDESHDELGVKIQKTKVTTLATNLMKRLFKANEADQDDDDDDGCEIEGEDVAKENKEVSKMEISLYDICIYIYVCISAGARPTTKST